MIVPKPAGVIFDLDGTLLDTLDDIVLALQKTLRRHGLEVPDGAAIARMVGDGARVLVGRAISRSAEDPLVSAVCQTFLELYTADPTPRTRLGDGADALLAALATRGIPAAVCTNKPGPLARTIVARMLGSRIVATVGGGDTAHLKPHPEPVLAAMAALDARAPLWMVGDGEQDMVAAHSAGITSILLREGYGSRSRIGEANLVIDRLDELIPYL